MIEIKEFLPFGWYALFFTSYFQEVAGSIQPEAFKGKFSIGGSEDDGGWIGVSTN